MARVQERSLFSWRNIFITAGIAFIAPYVVRRMLPLLQDAVNTTGRDVAIAGKDSVRDAADDLGVGGFTGSLKRDVNRVADRLT